MDTMIWGMSQGQWTTRLTERIPLYKTENGGTSSLTLLEAEPP